MLNISSSSPKADSKNGNATRFSNCRQYFNELIFDGFNFTNGYKCEDVHKIEQLNNLSINKFELKLYQDQNKKKYTLNSIVISKNESTKVVDLLIYKNHHALIKKLNADLGHHNKTFI